MSGPGMRTPSVVWALAFLAVCATSSIARDAPPATPVFKSLRHDEDYRAFRDPTLRRDATDQLKFLPLPGTRDGHLTLGGDVRLRYEYFDHAQWGQGPQDGNGYLLQRYMLHADAQVNETFRVFAQLKSGIEGGRNGGPRATDEDRLDLHQAFFDVRATPSLTVRTGRQELAYGSSRLISFREGPNVRQSFDGVRGLWRGGDWSVDAFLAAPVETRAGTFDDGYDRDRRLWGVYAVHPFPVLPGGNIDLYYLGLRRGSARFDQGAARERRHSLGTRLWGKHAGWDYNAEFVLQAGEFGAADIFAWTVASDVGYTFSETPLTPRVGLKANIASGDRDPGDDELNTFNALFPRGAYFAESGILGPANFFDVHPSLTVNPTPTLSVTVDVDFFWRQSTRDGLYGPAVNLLRSGQTSDARYVGSQASLLVEWEPGRHWNITTAYSRFFAGDFLRESGPGEDVDYVTLRCAYTF